MELGIDFGTSTIVVTKWNKETGEVSVIPGMGGYAQDYIENVVYFKENGEIIVGEAAKTCSSSPNAFAENYITGIKRNLLNKEWSRKIKYTDENGQLKTTTVKASEVCTKVFRYLKETIEKKNPNDTIDGIVLSVPYDYTADIRNTISNSATEAGFNVKTMIEEPVAASLCYGVFNSPLENNQSEKIVTVDFGGGTLDITAFEFRKNADGVIDIKTLATGGDSRLGGIDVTNILKDHFASRFSTPLTAKEDVEFFDYLNVSVKPMFSEFSDDSDNADVIFQKTNGDYIDEPLSVGEFRHLLEKAGFFDKIKNSLDDCIQNSGVPKTAYDKILLVGGTCKLQCVQQYLESYFGKKPFSSQAIDIFELVGLGAGLYCKCLSTDRNFRYNVIQKVIYAIGVVLQDGTFDPLITSDSDYDVPCFKDYQFESSSHEKDFLEIYQSPKNNTNGEKCTKIGYIEFDYSLYAKNRIKLSIQIKNHDITYILKDCNGEVKAQGSIFKL